jgi:glycosyltransferase involved in cell wall biosynthesis
MRIAILHPRLSPYFAACLRELKSRGVDLMIHAVSSDSTAPFEDSQFRALGEIHSRNSSSRDLMLGRVSEFNPDAILVGGWADREYMAVCRKMRAKGTLVVAGSDTQWKGSFRQHLAGFTAGLHIQRAIDVLWVSGERQRAFASVLGYKGERCWDGNYACDWNLFSSARRRDARTDQPPYFLFVGRYVQEKGIDTLVRAFDLYKDLVPDPWNLVCVGRGPLADAIQSAGAQDRGFVQPQNLPDLMSGAGGFVLPSRFEPWGVVIQEAAAVGLPLICSDACGAAVHLLRDCFNGFTFPTGNAAALAERMARISLLEDEQSAEMGERSFQLSKQYTPDRWVNVLLSGIERSKVESGQR